MPKRKEENNEELSDKLAYLGLNIDKIPEKFKKFEPLEFRVSKTYNEKQYRQYRFIPVKDIQILLSPTNRLDTLEEKYKKASPIWKYLDNKNEENILKHTTFLNMLKNMKIEDVEKVEQEQNKLSKNIPFKVKYEGNYLWQIYYSENTDKYFMIVPTEDTDYSTFFYVLKKQLEQKKTGKIFVPIINVQYSRKYLRKSEFEDLENYLWVFTKDWPSIYEVYDKNENLSIQIIGETYVFEKIRTPYKIKLETEKEANKFYKLIKALFILQTELPNYYNFSTNIDKKGSIEFYLGNSKIEYDGISDFIKEQFKIGLRKRKEAKGKIKFYNDKLTKLKELATIQEIEYLAKEKQISTFLECKKSFFGKFKYYFKYNKKTNKNSTSQNKNMQEENIEKTDLHLNKKIKTETTKIKIKKNYTLDELIDSYKELQELENQMKNVLMDLNAMKLKNKNLQKKIENASKYIEEIDKHKKSIFEFWKYSNKDEIAVLPEGEQEEVNVIKKIEKVFDYEEDIEEFGKKLDKIQRKILDKNYTDSIFIASTNLISILNKIKKNIVTPEEIKNNLNELKKEAIEQKTLTEREEFDIFGSIVEDRTKIKKIKDKRHRELPKDKFNILDINKNTNQLGYKLTLEQIVDNILKAIKKVPIPENLSIYKAINNNLDYKQINIFDINPEKELQEAIEKQDNDINFYKINIKERTKGVGFTNIIFYDNQNRTLPLGMDLSSKIIIDVAKLHLKLSKNIKFNIVKFENEDDEFSNVVIKTVNLLEYDVIELEDLNNEKK